MEADDMSLRVASFSCYLNNPEESLVQRIAGGSSEDLQRPDAPPFPVRARASSANVVQGVKPPSSNVKIPKAAAMDRSKDHKVSTASDHGAGESFSSSYLRTPENNNNNSGFAFKTTASGPVEDPTVSFVFPQHMNPAAAKHLERRIAGKSRKEDGEISIFDADKYFNMKLDQKLDLAYTAPIRSGKLVNKNKNEIPAVESKSSTVSGVSSEPSSFGSKAVLLHNPKPRKAAVIRRSFFGRFGCQGRCLDKKAVVIDDHHGSKQTAAEDSQKHSAGNTSKREEHPATTKPPMEEEPVDEQRKSLEVFGAHKTRKGDVAVNLERKLSVLTWDAIPNSPQLHAPTTAAATTSNTICDDMTSDASSDLFEIENISDSTRHSLMLASQTTAGDYCASPVTHYAPSEASITWSVVTAGVADHSSVISDYDENTVSIVGKTGKFKDVTGKPPTKPRFTGLLGCNSHGNLNISETAHNTGDRRKLGKSIHNCHSPDDFSSHHHLHA
ncbi:PREDICTED: protein PHYTOCHROME KINASE SUBSTRATE 3-like [Ipomoea nil]|uniref:protein PHYTOCHROME KINASE SUBSTRATE 3-like n=1 Tax=Ipomoea nil TaxID=35883 RepID=UPI0009012069|nr:PREDICTED: protein PHYTOCHROME KINASE SUBSTRATE 3-like [Ipomoea nil]